MIHFGGDSDQRCIQGEHKAGYRKREPAVAERSHRAAGISLCGPAWSHSTPGGSSHGELRSDQLEERNGSRESLPPDRLAFLLRAVGIDRILSPASRFR